MDYQRNFIRIGMNWHRLHSNRANRLIRKIWLVFIIIKSKIINKIDIGRDSHHNISIKIIDQIKSQQMLHLLKALQKMRLKSQIIHLKLLNKEMKIISKTSHIDKPNKLQSCSLPKIYQALKKPQQYQILNKQQILATMRLYLDSNLFFKYRILKNNQNFKMIIRPNMRDLKSKVREPSFNSLILRKLELISSS